MRMRVQSLASLSGSRIQCGCELWCGLQVWLGSYMAVAVAVALIRPLAWELPYAAGKAKKKKKKKKFMYSQELRLSRIGDDLTENP